jgi:predicted DCC family thiol-disulfide oxidoreductase YuxK
MSATDPASSSIVFFDGVCGLCNSFVDRLMRWDRKGVLRFAALQGDTAKKCLPPAHRAMDTLVYMDGHDTHTRSDAALRILLRLGGAWTLLRPLFLIPRPMRNAVYDLIARNRYSWFGKRATCRLPTPAERDRILP